MSELLRQWQLTAPGLEHLSCIESPLPQPGPGQVLVRVDAAALNYRDLMVTTGSYGRGMPHPLVPASDFAGTVAAVGAGVHRWQGGEQVISTFVGGWIDGQAPADVTILGAPGPGGLASHVLLDAQWLVAAPASASAVQASTLPCAGLTAWFALVEQGGLRAGQTVLVHGTGGVALFGVQLARLHGAQAIVVSGSADKRERALALGAHHALARDSNWPAEIRRLTGGHGVDQVLETVGGANVARSMAVLAQGGRLSMIGVLDGGEFTASTYDTLLQRAVVQGISVGHRRALEDLVRAVAVNRLQPVIAAEYGFEEVPAAFAHLARGAFGKVVVRM